MSNKPNILFLLTDEHSFRFMGWRNKLYNDGEPVLTPNLDSLAQNGTYFSTAYCEVPLCAPSRMCWWTGLHAHSCDAWDNASILDPKYITIPVMRHEIFQPSGQAFHQ